MINSIKGGTNPIRIQNRGNESWPFAKVNKIGDSDFWNGQKCFKCKLVDQLKTESVSESKMLLANQGWAGTEGAVSRGQESKQEETSKFILDFIPLCGEEDLELIAFHFGLDKEDKSS